MNARVGHAAFPFGKKQILFGQTRKAAALERVVLGKLHARLDLALVSRHRRARWQHGRAVMLAELRHLRVEFGIIPVRPRHGGAQIINDQSFGNATKIAKGIFQAPDEALGRLSPHYLAVSLSGMTQNDPKQVRPLALARHQHPRAQTKIHLRFNPRLHLHPHEWHRLRLEQLPHETLHRVIAAGKLMPAHQVLINPLRRQPRLHRRRNDRPQWHTQTLSASSQTPGERNGRF